MHNSIRRVIWRAVVLTALMLLAASQGNSAPSVLVIAPSSTNRDSSVLKVLSFSADGRKEIAELKGQVWYGTDEDSAAFLQINGPRSAGLRLLVVDRKTLAIIADKTLGGVH